MNLINIAEIAIGVIIGCSIFVFVSWFTDKIKIWYDQKKYGD